MPNIGLPNTVKSKLLPQRRTSTSQHQVGLQSVGAGSSRGQQQQQQQQAQTQSHSQSQSLSLYQQLQQPQQQQGQQQQGKGHKGNESTSTIDGSTGYQNGSNGPPLTAGIPTATPQEELVLSIIRRIWNSLPANSGSTLAGLDSDLASQQLVESLVSHSRTTPDFAVSTLTDYLDRVDRVQNVDPNGIGALQSRLYLLKVIHYLLSSRAPPLDLIPAHDKAKQQQQAAAASGASNSLLKETLTRQSSFGSSGSGSGSGTGSETPTPSTLDNFSLSTDVAQRCLAMATSFLRYAPDNTGEIKTAESIDNIPILDELEATDSRISPFAIHSSRSRDNSPNQQPATEYPGRSAMQSPSLRSGLGIGKFTDLATPQTIANDAKSLLKLTSKFASHVVFYLSATNWETIFGRVQKKLRDLSNKNSGWGNVREDLTDFKLITSCAVDRGRLSYFLQEVSSLWLHIPKEFYPPIAHAVRQTVWNWLHVYPVEYADIMQSNHQDHHLGHSGHGGGHGHNASHHQNLFDPNTSSNSNSSASQARGNWNSPNSNPADQLYDNMANKVTEDNKRFLWPALVALLAISKERLHQAEVQFGADVPASRGGKKRNMLLENIQKALHGNNSVHWELALVCFVDLCQAALLLPRMGMDGQSQQTSFADELAEEIRGHLLQPPGRRQPWYLSDEAIDITLYSDALFVLSRLQAEKTLKDFIVPCLEPERSDAVKVTVIRTLLNITNELRRWGVLEAQGVILPLYDAANTRIRSIFAACSVQQPEMGDDKKARVPSRFPSMKGDQLSDGLSERDLTTISILALWRADPGFFLNGAFEGDDMTLWTKRSLGVTTKNQHRIVRLVAFRAFENFAAIPTLMIHGIIYQEEIFQWMCIGAAEILGHFSFITIHSFVEPQEERMCAGLLKSDLFFWASTEEHPASVAMRYGADRLATLAIAEVALLLCLVSAQPSVVTSACDGLRLLAAAERHQKAQRPTHFTPDMQITRLPVYEKLWDTKADVSGRVSQQKRVRALLRTIAAPCVTFTTVWMEVYRRFTTLHKLLSAEDRSSRKFKSQREWAMSPNNEPMKKWSNYLLFLAAFCGACEDEEVKSLRTVVPLAFIPDFMQALDAPKTAVQNFFQTCLNELTEDSIELRTVLKEALGVELHHKHIPTFFGILEKRLSEYFDTPVEPEFDSSIHNFLDSILSILQTLFKQDDEATITALASTEFQYLMLIAKYLDGLDPEQHGDFLIKLLHLRNKLCMVCDAIIAQRAILSFRSDYRNELLHRTTAWMLEVDHKIDLKPEIKLAFRDMSFKSLRTSVALTDNLALQPEQSAGAASVTHVLSGVFREHLSRFMKAFWLRDALPNQPAGEPKVQDLIVQGIGNMLLANSEAGMQACLEMAIDTPADTSKRYIACLIFSRVLQQGTQLVASSAAPVDYRNPLCELIRSSNLALPIAMCQNCPTGTDKPLLSALLHIYQDTDEIMGLAKAFVEKEINSTVKLEQLWRADSIFTSGLSMLGRSHGQGFLEMVLQHAVDFIQNTAGSFDVDPMGEHGYTDASIAAENIKNLAISTLTFMCKNGDKVPAVLIAVSRHIYEIVAGRDPKLASHAVGGFLFLRYITPALTNPDIIYYEVPQGNIAITKGMQMLGRILLAMATNNKSQKNPTMARFSDFQFEKMGLMTNFLKVILDPPALVEIAPRRHPGSIRYDEADGIFIHHFLKEKTDTIGIDLLGSSITNAKELWDLLCAKVVEAGNFVTRPKQTSDPKSAEQLLTAHFRRYRNHDKTNVNRIFFELETLSDDAAFMLTVRELFVEKVEFELLVAHILKIVGDRNRRFDVVIDCTSFSTASELPIQWVKMFLQLMPVRISHNFRTAYIVSTNELAQRYIRKLHSICFGFPLADEVFIDSGFKELRKRAPELIFPPDYDTLEEPLVTDYEVEARSELGVYRQRLIFHESYLKIFTTRRRRVYPTLHAVALDVLWFRDITDAYVGTENTDFVICRKADRIYLHSERRDDIVRDIKNAKATIQDDRRRILGLRVITQTDLYAALAHVGLWNSCDEDQSVRSVALSLLISVASNLGVRKADLPLSKGTVPRNINSMTLLLSERLALATPESTLSLLHRCWEQFSGASLRQRLACLNYLSPWLANLPQFWDPVSPHYDTSLSTLRTVLQSLVDLAVTESDIAPSFERSIWQHLTRLDERFLGYVTDILIQKAVDSPKSLEMVGEILVSMSCTMIRAKLLSKLRKALGKVPESKEDRWREIGALAHLVQVTTNPSKQHPVKANTFHIPELLYIVTLLSGLGPLSSRISTFMIAQTLMNTLANHLFLEGGSTEPTLAHNYEGLMSAFGLTGKVDIAEEYALKEFSSDEEAVDMLVTVTEALMDSLLQGGKKGGLQNDWRTRFVSLISITAFQYPLWIKSRAWVVLTSIAPKDTTEDMQFQLLRSLAEALATAGKEDGPHIIALLRCLARMGRIRPERSNSALPEATLWFSIALLGSPTIPLFREAVKLLPVAFRTLAAQRGSSLRTYNSFMGEVDVHDAILEMERKLGLSFRTDASFTTAALLFKGVKVEQVLDVTKQTLESFIHRIVTNQESDPWDGDPDTRPMHSAVLPYFLALLPVYNTPKLCRDLCKMCGAGPAFYPEIPMFMSIPGGITIPSPPEEFRIDTRVLGNLSENVVLMASTFICSMLKVAGQSDPEVLLLYQLLADLARTWPQVVGVCVESIRKTMLNLYCTTNCTDLLRALDTIWERTSMDDDVGVSVGIGIDDSVSSLRHRSSSSLSEFGPDQNSAPQTQAQRIHLEALGRLNMQGLANLPNYLTPNSDPSPVYRTLSDLLNAYT